jgi:hypothetical protein
VASGCGGNDMGSSGGASGLMGTKRLVELSDTEKGQLCDWAVSKVGSYANPSRCTQPTTLFVYADQAACIEDFVDPTDTDCTASVAQMEACVNALPVCATLSQVASVPACAAVLEKC